MAHNTLLSNTVSTLVTHFYNATNEPDQRNLEYFLVIWLVSNLDNIEENKLTSLKAQLRRIVNYLRTFDQPKTCVEYVNGIKDEKIFLIISASFCQQVLPLVVELEQVVSIYILFESKAHKISVKQQYEHKIIGKCDNINSICDRLKQDVASLSYNLIKIDVLSSFQPLMYSANDRQMESSFAAAQYRFERLLTTDVQEESNKKNISDECRLQYAGNDDHLRLVEEFDKDYHSNKAIWWYTRNIFLTNILNKAVRIMNDDILNKLQFFVVDLHRQLKQLHSQSSQVEPTIVYRGQTMSSEELDKLKSNVNGFLLINNFFLTCTCRDTALSSINHRVNVKSVLFQAKIDPAIDTKIPYASIQAFSYTQKEEVLFSIGSVFQIKTIRKIQNGIWNVVLLLCEKGNERLQEVNNTMTKALLSKAVNVRVTDANKRLYTSMFLNDMGKIYNHEKATFVDAIKLNFDQLKDRPRLIVDIEEGQYVSHLCPSTKLLLYYCSNKNIYIIDRNGNIINQAKWSYDYIYDICWSSFLNKFIIVADSPSFSFYTYDENSNEILRIEQQCYAGRVKSYENCRCYENIFTIGYHTTNWDLKICTYDVKEWKSISRVCREETLINMRFSLTTYIWVGVTERDWTRPKEESGGWRFELRDIACIDTVSRTVQLDDRMKSPRTVSLSNAEWLVYDTETKILSLIHQTTKSQTSIEYSENIENATLMDQNCFVILTQNNQFHFHNL